MTSTTHPARLAFVALIVALAAGSVMRLAWLDDIEYKADEAWVYHAVCDHLETGQFSAHGAPSSQNVRHMGMSIWMFYPLGWLFGADEPTNLACGVACLNIAALLLLTLLVR